MRIVGGKYRSRVLYAFDGDKIRPTADKVRESVFNILQTRIVGCRFLDMFCGTGAMGIEAISRGAREVAFNDKSATSLELLRKNLALLRIADGYKIYGSDALTLSECALGKFDIIYVDPPYKEGLGRNAVVCARKLLSDGGVIVFEDEKPFDGAVEGLKITDGRKYGRVFLTFFMKE